MEVVRWRRCKRLGIKGYLGHKSRSEILWEEEWGEEWREKGTAQGVWEVSGLLRRGGGMGMRNGSRNKYRRIRKGQIQG